MNKMLVFVVLFVALAVSVSATCVGNVQVHAVDNDGKDLSGVNVAPEWKFDQTGWNDYFPKEKTTDDNGLAGDCLWLAVNHETIEVNYATIDGYTCTRGEDTQIVAENDGNVLQTVCTPDNQVPEFGVIAALVAVVGAIGIVVVRRH
jgi:hypothetical protein